MRIVTNEALIERNRKISHILFFLSLAGMGVGFFYTWTSNPAGQTNQISCFVLPFLLLMTMTSVRMANTWIREPQPRHVLNDALKGLGKKYTVFYHLLPAPHVLIGPEGVFTLTTVWQERPYRVVGQKWYGDEGLVRKLSGYMRQDLLGNPFQNAQLEAQQMQKLVGKIAPDSGVEVQPLVVFISSKAHFESEDPLFPVLYADPKRKPALRSYLRDQKGAGHATLGLDELDKIDELYGLTTRQELAEITGEAIEYDQVRAENATSGLDTIAEEKMTSRSEAGTIFITQLGQLYFIGATTGSVEEEIANLQAPTPTSGTIKLIHMFETDDLDAAQARLHHKFERKRQKEHWFGLSKKDIAWLETQ